jgi:phosphoribosylamine-glycine ligase
MFGAAGSKIIMRIFNSEEASIQALCVWQKFILLASAQDHQPN